jgi:TRAP transporter TAXI family solute receptor
VSKGEAELGFAQGVVAVAAANGEDPYDQKYENVRAIASLYASTGQLVVTKDSGITSIQEIIDKQIPVRIAVDNPGSTQEMTNKRLLEAYGTSYEDIESWGGQVVYKGFSDAAGMMNEGLVDALSTLTIVPAAPVQEAANNKEIVMLPIDPSVVDTMSKKYGYVADTIPASSYSFLNDDLTTLSTRCSLICSTELSEEDAYNITKAIVENLDYLRTVHNNIKELTPEEMAVGTGVPLHPGAEKYYKEIGAIN